MDGEFIETPCQAFKVFPPMVIATKCSSDVSKAIKVMPKMVSFKDARVAVEEVSCDTWGKLLDIPFKADKCGLGFTIKAQKEVRRARAGKPPLCIGSHKVNTVGDSDNELHLKIGCILLQRNSIIGKQRTSFPAPSLRSNHSFIAFY